MQYLIKMNMGGTWIVWDTFKEKFKAEYVLEKTKGLHPHNEWTLIEEEDRPPSDIDMIRNILKQRIVLKDYPDER